MNKRIFSNLSPDSVSVGGESHTDELVVQIEPYSLLHHQRFDLMAKYIYAKHRELKINSHWAKQLYDAHIRVFNGYVENDDSEKHGIEAFIDSFHDVLDSIKESGFKEDSAPIPIGGDGVIIDGAHRVSAGFLYGKSLRGKYIKKNGHNFGYHYFALHGLEEKWRDAIAMEYCRTKKSVFIAIIYPSANGRNSEIREILSKHGNIFYEKSIVINKSGQVNLIREIYHSEPWLGNWKNGFAGAQNKAFGCFQGQYPVRVFVLDSESSEMLNAKLKIRELFQIGNHSIHINDTHEEAQRLAQVLFNKNSIHFMNHAQFRHFKWFNRLFSEYKNLLSTKNKEYFCIDGGAVLAAYGLRETGDIDYLHYGVDELDTNSKAIESNNNDNYHLTTIDDIIFNPDNHFYYDGIKFASLNVIKARKQKRRSQKDLRDVQLIDNLLRKQTVNRVNELYQNLMLLLSPRYLYSRARMLGLKIRFLRQQSKKNLKIKKQKSKD